MYSRRSIIKINYFRRCAGLEGRERERGEGLQSWRAAVWVCNTKSLPPTSTASPKKEKMINNFHLNDFIKMWLSSPDDYASNLDSTLINYVSLDERERRSLESFLLPPKRKTMMTSCFGYQWNFLQPPRREVEGKSTFCDSGNSYARL
jgi:hypothetical protein